MDVSEFYSLFSATCFALMWPALAADWPWRGRCLAAEKTRGQP